MDASSTSGDSRSLWENHPHRWRKRGHWVRGVQTLCSYATSSVDTRLPQREQRKGCYSWYVTISLHEFEHTTDVFQEIERETGYHGCELRTVDLANFASAVAFADKFEKEVSDLHILVMNAGVLEPIYQLTTDGWEPMSVHPA